MRAVVLLLGLLGACQRTGHPPPGRDKNGNALPDPPSLSTSAALTLTAQVESPGLKVATGTLAATSGASGALWGFSDLQLDLQRVRLEIVPAPGGAVLASLLPEHGLAVVNGGYFEADFRPSTWVKNAGQELAPKSDTSKGGVLAIAPSGVYLGPFSGLKLAPELAIQSFPLLIEPDHKVGIRSDDGRHAARTVVCQTNDGALHLIVLAAPRGEGPTLFDSATLMHQSWPDGFNCRVALNLDGGPSTGVVFGPAVAAKSRIPASKVGYAIAVMPR
jgi:uncharacterized protein YigE (DUF2233 family)